MKYVRVNDRGKSNYWEKTRNGSTLSTCTADAAADTDIVFYVTLFHV
jgi:hypothetical protein